MYTYYVSVWIKYISYLHVNFLTSQPRHLEPQNSRLKLKTITQLRAIHFYLAKNKRNAPRINEKLHKISLSWALLPASFCCSTSLETFWTKLSTNGEHERWTASHQPFFGHDHSMQSVLPFDWPKALHVIGNNSRFQRPRSFWRK